MKKYSEIPKDIFLKMEEIGEDIFGTFHDVEQIPITEESRQKLNQLTPYWLHYVTDEHHNPISWVVVIPTQKELAIRFLNKEISENEMFQMTQSQEKYDAVYLCAAITIPKYRKQGLVKKLFKEILEYIPITDDGILFTWLSTQDGKDAFHGIENILEKKILFRE